MLISCEKCSTTYVLDEAVIPPAGAPVQCTRCSHVFTAYPPTAAEAKPNDLEDEPTTTKKKPPMGARPANQTMVFGQDPGVAPNAPKAANQTMVFGAQPSKPAPPAAPAPPRPNQTMIFGGQGPSPQPPSGPANQTMVFGTQQPPAAPAKPSASSTMVFGAPTQPAPPPAKPATSTMVFGAPTQPAPPNKPSSVAFGTPAGQQAAQPAAPPSSHQTLVFGTSPVAQPPASHQTVMFGTPAGQQVAAKEPPPKPAANQTLVFGASPVAAPQPKPTMAFGTPAGQSAASGLPAPANQTLVFGATPVNVPEPTTAPQPVPSKNQTMMFGKPPEVAAAPNRTMAFGMPRIDRAPEEEPEPEQQRSESTVRVDLEQMMRQHEGGQNKAGSEAESAEAVQGRHDRTNLFAMSSMQETTKPDAHPTSTSGTAPELGRNLSLDGAQTLPPNLTSEEFFADNDRQPDPDPPGVSTLLEPGGFDSRSTVKNDGPISSTMPNLAPIERATDVAHRSSMAVEQLGETPLSDQSSQKTSEFNDDAAVAIASSGRRRVVVAVVIIFLLLLAGGSFVVWQFFGKQFFARVDPKLQQEVLQAVEHFRQDDSQVRKTELEALEKLVKENPTFADAHAALVLGLALELDDLNAEHAFLKVRYEALNAQFGSLPKEDPKKGPLAKRINAFSDRSKELAPLLTNAWQRVTKAGAALDGLASEPTASVIRARSMLKAVRGEGVAPAPAQDYWGKLVPAVSAANSKASPEELRSALDEVNAVRAEEGNAELGRPHVLAARLFLLLKDDAAAKAALEVAAKNAPNLAPAVAGLATLKD